MLIQTINIVRDDINLILFRFIFLDSSVLKAFAEAKMKIARNFYKIFASISSSFVRYNKYSLCQLMNFIFLAR